MLKKFLTLCSVLSITGLNVQCHDYSLPPERNTLNISRVEDVIYVDSENIKFINETDQKSNDAKLIHKKNPSNSYSIEYEEQLDDKQLDFDAHTRPTKTSLAYNYSKEIITPQPTSVNYTLTYTTPKTRPTKPILQFKNNTNNYTKTTTHKPTTTLRDTKTNSLIYSTHTKTVSKSFYTAHTSTNKIQNYVKTTTIQSNLKKTFETFNDTHSSIKISPTNTTTILTNLTNYSTSTNKEPIFNSNYNTKKTTKPPLINSIFELRSAFPKTVNNFLEKENDNTKKPVNKNDSDQNKNFFGSMKKFRPKFQSANGIEFKLWTRRNRNKPEVQRLDMKHSLHFKKIDFSNPVVFVVHGSYNAAQLFNNISKAFLDEGNNNVVGVDWTSLTLFCRKTVIENTLFVGKELANAIDYLRRKGAKYIHLVAHGSGNLVAATAASNVRRGKIERITALDPIDGSRYNVKQVLSTYSAKLVEVIHTSGGYTSMLQPMGHRDFYPNGGKWPQPGCKNDVFGRCSSRKAYEIYSNAIKNPQKFKAVQCLSYAAYLANKCSKGKSISLWNKKYDGFHGTYYFKTDKSTKKIWRSKKVFEESTKPTCSCE